MISFMISSLEKSKHDTKVSENLEKHHKGFHRVSYKQN